MDFPGILGVNERRNICVFVRMKILPALGCGLLLVLSLPELPAQQVARSFAREMAVNAEVQEQFFAKYPDLKDEREVVAVAARQPAEPGNASADRTEAAEALAARARELLARRTPQEWQRKAVNLYPELGVAGSEFNRLFLQRYQELKGTSPQFEDEPSWPVLLAKRCADELRARSAPVSQTDSTRTTGVKASPITGADAAGAPAPQRPQSFWLSALSVVLLAAILWLPAHWMFGISRAFAGWEEPVTLWQKALRPAAWTYLAVALIALFRTFQANADLGFFDRFGITLLVSVLAGGFFAPLAFAIAWGVAWWQCRTAERAELIRLSQPAEPRTLPRKHVAK